MILQIKLQDIPQLRTIRLDESDKDIDESSEDDTGYYNYIRLMIIDRKIIKI